MGKNKLQKFEQMETFPHVFQAPFGKLSEEGFAMKGKWNKEFFKNDNPIVLELGCGKGEYTVALADRNPDVNYIGVDIKGARMWNGAKKAFERGMTNVAFIRTQIELIDHFFVAGEISEIWLTFPDPQMKKVRKRLTSTRFLELYRKFLVENGIVNLKTDSNFQYTYTYEMAKANTLTILENITDVHNTSEKNDVLNIRTHYEEQWLERGLTIKFISFEVPATKELIEPDVEIEYDSYRSYNRSRRRGEKSTGE